METARVIPTGRYRPLFADAAALKGWEESVLRTVIDANGDLLVHMALKAQEAGRLYGLERRFESDIGLLLSGPVSASAGRKVLIWFAPAESEKEPEDSGEGGKGKDAKAGMNAIDELLAEIGDPEAGYEEMRTRPDAEEGVPVRLRFEVYDWKEPFIVREDIAHIETEPDAEEKPVDPSFGISMVFSDSQMEIARRAIEKAGWKPAYEGRRSVRVRLTGGLESPLHGPGIGIPCYGSCRRGVSGA